MNELIYLLDWHHAEGNVSRGCLISAAYMVHLVGLREHHIVVLQNNGICIRSRLDEV